jgi:hypothetical protein
MIQVLASDGDACDLCMAVSSESAPVCLEKVVITLDGGSDVHLADARFCRGVPVLKTECRLRDVQQALIPVYGAAVVPFVLDKTIAVTSRFDIAEIPRPIWSVGLLYDDGYDIVISHTMGTYISHKDEPEERIQMTRVRNCFGILADRYEDAEEADAAAELSRAQNPYLGGEFGDAPMDVGAVTADDRPKPSKAPWIAKLAASQIEAGNEVIKGSADALAAWLEMSGDLERDRELLRRVKSGPVRLKNGKILALDATDVDEALRRTDDDLEIFHDCIEDDVIELAYDAQDDINTCSEKILLEVDGIIVTLAASY